MKSYSEAALEGASGVDLVVALYDGLIRFLVQAAAACDAGNAIERRVAVRRALEIIIHLQSCLRPGVGGKPAERLAEFYAALFATILRASAFASGRQLLGAVQDVRNVREAWQTVAQNHRPIPRDLETHEERMERCGPPMSVPQLQPATLPHVAEARSNWLA